MRSIKIVILLLAAVAASWLTTWVDGGLGSEWTHIVVRNWEQFGYFQLHGKLVSNCGGFEAVSHPDVYAGHRAASLVPAFILFHLSGGSDWGIYAYYALVILMLSLSVWQLLGRTERAFWLAAVVALVPGNIRWQTSMDPNLVAVLFGFPFSAALIALLSQTTLKWFHWVALLLVISIYSSLNWTTVFVHGMLFVTLLLLGRVSPARLAIYAGLTAALAGFVVLASVASKAKTAGGPDGGVALLLQSYGWGHVGYGLDLTTTTACVRMLTANVVGLLPMLIFLGWQFWRREGWRARGGWIFILPALVPVVEVLVMRNYFGHHPWMSVHYILLGIILAATVWKARMPSAPAEAEPKGRLAFRAGCLAAVFGYSLLVLGLGYIHMQQQINLVTLVRDHSTRNTTVVITRDTDPELAALELRLPELFDRHLVVVPSASAASLAAAPAPRIILTAVRPPASVMVAETGAAAGNPLATKLLGWYSAHIAHRRTGDKLDIGDNYFLRQPPSN